MSLRYAAHSLRYRFGVRGVSLMAGAACLSGCSFLFAPSDDAASGTAGTPAPSSDAAADVASEEGSSAADVVELLREGLSSPDSLIVDATSLTWIEPGTAGRLVRVPLGRWDQETVIAGGQKNPYRAIDYAGALYWTTRDDASLHRLDVTGDVAYGGAPGIGGLAGAGGSIYFAYAFVPGTSLEKCSPSECFGGSALYVRENAIDQLRSTPRGLAWLAANVLRACNTSDIGVENGPYDAFVDPSGIDTFASDTDYFFVAAASGIVALPLTARAGAGAQPLLVDTRVVTALVSDGNMLYCASEDGRITKVPRVPDSSAPVDFAHTTKGPVRSLVASGGYVYWSEGDAIRRVRKPP